MGKTFVCSLCRNGIIGGGLYIDEQSITYSTQKLTVSPLYRSLVLPMKEIKEISWSQMVVPVAAISMKDGECYKFIIYNKSGFERHISNIATTKNEITWQGLGQARPNKKLSQRGRKFSRIENLWPRDDSCSHENPYFLKKRFLQPKEDAP